MVRIGSPSWAVMAQRSMTADTCYASFAGRAFGHPAAAVQALS